jgi:hypothetical protein
MSAFQAESDHPDRLKADIQQDSSNHPDRLKADIQQGSRDSHSGHP